MELGRFDLSGLENNMLVMEILQAAKESAEIGFYSDEITVDIVE